MSGSSGSSGYTLLVRFLPTIVVIVLLGGATLYLSNQSQANLQALNSIESQVSILRNQTIPTITVTPTLTITVTTTPTITTTTTITPSIQIVITNATASASGGISLNVLDSGNTAIASLTVSVTPVLGSDTYSCVNQSLSPGQSTVCVSKGSTLPSETKAYHIQVIASNVLGYFVAATTVTAGP